MPRRNTQIELSAVAFRRGWQRCDQLQTLVQVRNRFGERHVPERQTARLLPKRDRLLGLFRLGVVVRQQLGLGCLDVRETLLDYLGDPAVQFLPAPPEQRVVGGVLHQRVLKGVDRIGRRALLKGKGDARSGT